ncbi:hypothetical protein F511_28751 [Dorcoceras hygrometricum]|uniref:Uncharacterized protein n=1 Tax=Dorcoceras hygrometricum TaxID=472368 RepID=A0A2Z7C6F9_9LAMI|nr:hypothetical protein F511_28751 [Dorcoceras hygrometricum]
MQRIKATTESRESNDRNNSSTARSDQRKYNQFVATGILSTWELPTHLQYTIPDANNQLQLLLLTHEMWELPTRLIADNKPSRENEVRDLPAQPPRYTGTTHSSLNIASWYSQFNRTGIASKIGSTAICVYANATADIITQAQTTQGRCLRTPHQLQANVRKQYPNEASQQEESNATTLTLVGAVYRRQSKKIRFGQSCSQYPPHLIHQDWYSRSQTDLATDLSLSPNRSLLTQTTSQRTTVATGHVTRYSLLNTNQHLLATLQQISHTADANATHSWVFFANPNAVVPTSKRRRRTTHC